MFKFKRLRGFFSAFFGDKPICIYNCQMSGASYCMHRHGKGFVVEKTQVLGDMNVTKTISLVESGESEHDLAHRFLEVIERDARACSNIKKAA